MISQDLNELRSPQNGLCVSIIVPAYKTSPDSWQSPTIMAHAIDEATELVRNAPDAEEVISRLHDAAESIDYLHTGEGIAVFVAPGFTKVVQLPFTVTKKITAGDRFEIRDVVFAANYLIDYWVLSLSKNASHLYKGRGGMLEEEIGTGFPIQFKELYEQSESPTASNPDKSQLKQTREKQYFQKVDKLLGNYLNKENLPVIVAGIDKYITEFKEVSKHRKSIAGEIAESFAKGPLNRISQLSWEAMQDHGKTEKKRILAGLEEVKGQVYSGVKSIITNIDRIDDGTLYVEKDFKVPVEFQSELFNIHLNGGMQTMTKKMGDAVDSIIETVLQREGKIVFVENGSLEGFDHIVLKPSKVRL